MTFTDLILIAFGVSFSVFAIVLMSSVERCLTLFDILKISFFFGFFQGLMMFLGWLLCSSFSHLLMGYTSWIIFAFFIVIGLKMIFKSLKVKPEERTFNLRNIKILTGLSFASGINSFIIGLTLALTDVSILNAVVVVVLVTFFISIAGIYIGKKTGKYSIGNKIEFLGGIIFIALGMKILLHHFGVI
ncbi:MAG: manganese efflux pump [Bacteroidetes bacterium]|nr:manganese efflux pump [Bacteroidota bacterium]